MAYLEPDTPPPSLSSESSYQNAGKSPPPPETRDWALLPRDILCEVFHRTGHVDILFGAGLACTAWRSVAVDEPALWRHVDLYEKDNREDDWYWTARMAMARSAVDRSRGQCESFRGPADRYLLVYLAARAPLLRSLEIISLWCLPDAFVDRVIPKIPMLEVLTMVSGHLFASTLRALLHHCPRLHLLNAGHSFLDKDVTLNLLTECHNKFKVFKVVSKTSPICYCVTCLYQRRGRFIYNINNII
ncbi:hypothetical protein QOZ80_7BG0606530 [Eleusine coracana subsp. coracana]|nr:hypothetical protein QOZ80_7BG0606530 [Eleusine coracana subsp. coracana]